MSKERQDAEKKAEADSSAACARHEAHSRLMAFLDEIRTTMPDVPEEDAQKDIEEAIAAIRNETQD